MARLKKMLLAREIDAVEQGLELVFSLDNPEVHEALLNGVEFNDGRFKPNNIFSGTRPAQPFHDYALWNLVARLETDKAAALRKAATSLIISRDHARGPDKISLKRIERLSALESLRLEGPWVLENAGAIGALPALKRLTLSVKGLDGGYAGLERAASLEQIKIRVADDDDTLAGLSIPTLKIVEVEQTRAKRLQGFAKLKNLVTLNISGATQLEDINELAELPKLEQLQLHGTAFTQTAVFRCPSLKTLRIQNTQMRSLVGLGKLPALESLYIWSAPSLTEVGALECPKLQTINLHQTGLKSLQGMGELPALKEISVTYGHQLAELSTLNCPSLEKIVLRQVGLHSLAGLDAAPKLQQATIYGAAELSEIGFTQPSPITSLTLGNSRKLEQVSSLEHAFALETLSLESCNALQDISSLAKISGLKSLRLSYAPVKSIEPLAELHKLESVYLHALQGLEHLDRLPEVPKFGIGGEGRLNLSSFKSLRSIKGLASLSQEVEHVDLHGCVALTSLDGLEGVQGMKSLDLRRCTKLEDLSALEDCDVRVIAIRESNVVKEELPESVAWAASVAERVDFSRMKTRQPRVVKRKYPVPEAMVPDWISVQKGIQQRSAEGIKDVLKVAKASGKQELFDAVLKGVRWREQAGYHSLEGGGPLRRLPGALGGVLAWNLLEVAPEGTKSAKAALQNAPEALSASTEQIGQAAQLGLSKIKRAKLTRGALTASMQLEKLPNLRLVELNCDLGETGDLSALHAASNLEHLLFGYYWGKALDLSSLSGLRKLRGLFFSGEMKFQGMEHLQSMEHLRFLKLFKPGTKSALAGVHGLTHLELRGQSATAAIAAADLPKLEWLTIAESATLDLETLGKCTALRALTIESAAIEAGAERFSALPHLENLTIRSGRSFTQVVLPKRLKHLSITSSNLEDLELLEGMESLETLDLSRCSTLKSLEGLPSLPNLVSLKMSQIYGPGLDLTPLKACTKLERIGLYYTQLQHAEVLSELPALEAIHTSAKPAIPEPLHPKVQAAMLVLPSMGGLEALFRSGELT